MFSMADLYQISTINLSRPALSIQKLSAFEVEVASALVVEIVPPRVVDMVPVRVVEIVPVRVVEIVPDFAMAVDARNATSIMAPMIDLKFFIVVSW